MAIRTYKVTLDSKNTIAPEPVYLRQGDKTGAVVIDATLMDNGVPVSLDGLTPMFKANTAGGQAVIADSTGFTVTDSANGKFTYQVPNALSAVPGKITTAYFSFSDSSGSESTFDVAFIIKAAVDISQRQAEDYITIIDGTLNSLQKKIGAMNTDIQTVLNAYNQGDFYNKSETDSRDGATLSSAKAYIYNSLSGIVALPETFANLAAIKAKYPSGKNGLMVAADNGHKYIWANSTWTDAGIYQAVGISDTQYQTGLIKSGTTFKNDTIYTPFNFSGGSVADGALYISGAVFKAGQADRIRLRCLSSGNIKLNFFYFDPTANSINNNDNVSLTLARVISANVTIGDNYIDVDFLFNKPFVIGIHGAGWVYDYSTYPSAFASDYVEGNIGNVYPNIVFGGKITPDLSIFYNSANDKYQASQSKTAILMSTALPSYEINKYPIVFDFTTGTCNFNGTFIEEHLGSDFNFAVPSSLTLPPLDQTDGFQYFFLIYDYINFSFNIIHSKGSIHNGNLLSQQIICGFAVEHATNSIKKTCHFYGFNDTAPLVIFHHATTGNDVNNGSINDMEDYASKRISEHGLYHYTYFALGDSITAGENPSNGYIPMYSNRYPDIVAQTLGMFTYIDGIGGTTISNIKNGMYERANNITQYYDIISVFGGTNDFASNVVMGNTDGSDTDMSHFYPAFEALIKTLVEKEGLPFVITPTGRENQNTPNTAGLILEDYVNAEIEIAKKYHVPVLDLFHTFTYNAGTSGAYKTAYMPDGLHPNIDGMQKLGMRVVNFIDSLLRTR